MNTKEKIRMSLGKIKGDIILKGGKIANVLTREIITTDVVISGEYIAYVGNDTLDFEGSNTRIIDVKGMVISPGLIESHIHIESSMLTLTQFSQAVIPHGTTTCVVDPHELANILGVPGLEVFIKEANVSPIRYLIEVPSCVPSLPGFETSGAILDSDSVRNLLKREETFALAEMMNYPGVLFEDKEVIAKIDAAKSIGKLVEGHAPLLKGKELQAYISAGISSDHESTSSEEVLEKLRLGMKVQIREGSFAKDMANIFKDIKDFDIDTRNLIVASDDRNPVDLKENGHLDYSYRLLISLGLEPLKALQMITINTATHLGMEDEIGSISPGKKADIVIVDDLEKFNVLITIANGEVLFEKGKLSYSPSKQKYPKFITKTMKNLEIPQYLDLMIKAPDKDKVKVLTIGIEDNSLLTNKIVSELKVVDGYIQPDIENDILPIVVVNRHTPETKIGKGFVKGLGLKNGAIASTVAHDCHQLICAGTNYDMMIESIWELKEANGGQVVITPEKNVILPLEFAGIMSIKEYKDVISDIKSLHESLKILKPSISEPFMGLAFIALPVIPHLKLTDHGLIDVDKFEFTNVIVD